MRHKHFQVVFHPSSRAPTASRHSHHEDKACPCCCTRGVSNFTSALAPPYWQPMMNLLVWVSLLPINNTQARWFARLSVCLWFWLSFQTASSSYFRTRSLPIYVLISSRQRLSSTHRMVAWVNTSTSAVTSVSVTGPTDLFQTATTCSLLPWHCDTGIVSCRIYGGTWYGHDTCIPGTFSIIFHDQIHLW